MKAGKLSYEICTNVQRNTVNRESIILSQSLEKVGTTSTMVDRQKQIQRVERIEKEAEHLRLKYVQLQKLKTTHLRELEDRVTTIQNHVLERKQFELEAGERRTALATQLDRLQQDIICTNKERRLMRKQLYDLKMRQAGTLGNAKNFFKGIQILMDDSLATQHNHGTSRTTSKPLGKKETTTTKTNGGGRRAHRKQRTSEVCGELNDRLSVALIRVRDLEIGRFSSFKL